VPTLVLVRHGVTPATGSRLGGHTPASLSEEGVAQVTAAAERLAALRVAAVHTSPIQRTRETAAILAGPHDLEPVVADGLVEVDYGDWTDRPLRELREEPLWRTIQRAPSRVTFPGGGTIRGMQAAAVEEVERIAAAHDPYDVVLGVSHADVIKAVVAHVAGVGLDGFQRFVIGPASTTVVHLPPGGPPLLLATNSYGPVEVPSPPPEEDAE
jgi:probable phosphomutase (TIGR03848 family)